MKAILLYLVLAVCTIAADRFDSVAVSNRARPLTNATIKTVTANGITFLCDQGLIQVPYDKLPPAFAVYKSKTSQVAVSQSVPKSPVVVKTTSETPAVKTPVQVAQDAKKLAYMKKVLSDKIAKHEQTISRYDRQSSFSKGPLISTEDYELAKAELPEFRAQLEMLNK
jgi:hypothetical protein